MKSLYLCSILLLTGCIPTPKYVAPAGAPHALIRSEMVSLQNRHNSLTLTEAPPTGCKFGTTTPLTQGKQLLSVHENVSTPEGFFPIEAGKQLHLVLRGLASADRVCWIAFVSEFAPGARYVIKGGIVDNPDKLGGCYIDIFNADSGERVPVAKPPTLERKCKLDHLLTP